MKTTKIFYLFGIKHKMTEDQNKRMIELLHTSKFKYDTSLQ